MTNPVAETPPLPYPAGAREILDLSTFDQDLVRALFTYLGEIARHTNSRLPKDGSEPATGDLDLGGFDIVNGGDATFADIIADAITVDGVALVPEEGTWVPTMTFATPGNLSVVYTTQEGTYLKIGRLVFVRVRLVCTPTHTTASGNWTLEGLPVAATNTPVFAAGSGIPNNIGAGFTWPAGVSMVAVNVVPNTTTAVLSGSGSGIAQANFTHANVTSGAALTLVASVVYEAAA